MIIRIDYTPDVRDPLIIMNWNELAEWLKSQGFDISRKESELVANNWRQLEITKKQLKIMPKPKGYGISDVAVSRLVKEKNLTQYRRGRENWYVKSEVDALPAKK